MYNALDVAAHILEVEGETPASRVHRLLYLCQGHHLVENGVPLFEDPLYAYPNGVAVKTVYDAHAGHFTLKAGFFGPQQPLDAGASTLVQQVVETYREYDGPALAGLSRQSTPWIVGRRQKDRRIPVEEVYGWFQQALAAQ